MPTNPWLTQSSRVTYQNPWIRVREDLVLRPDGQPGLYGVVEIRPSVGMVATDENDRIVLVEQWRYAPAHHSIEIPRGGSQPGEADMLAVAKRELAEEAGLLAQRWKCIGPVDVCNGVTDDVQTLYWATGLSTTEMNLDPEEDIVVQWQPFDEAVRMVMDGRITEVCSVAAILKVAFLRNSRK
ncbi:MAG TPA: NUDIX hydrolase [Bryobacteraceae bacterium]|jgi:8-oxo-dGTP pyrophosphatase MutT (NUDIX family)|nr:NUDIX hydrolase [Bryobacteraceae bacterium]